MRGRTNKMLLAVTMLILASGIAVASDTTDVMAPIHQFVDGFNKGDAKTALAACADQTSIIDEFAPYAWQGAGACTAWLNDYEVDVKKKAVTDGVVTLGKPSRTSVTGDLAYVVVPANYTFKEKGKPMKETGSTFTFVLKKSADGWRITSWAWGAK